MKSEMQKLLEKRRPKMVDEQRGNPEERQEKELTEAEKKEQTIKTMAENARAEKSFTIDVNYNYETSKVTWSIVNDKAVFATHAFEALKFLELMTRHINEVMYKRLQAEMARKEAGKVLQ